MRTPADTFKFFQYMSMKT